MPKDTKHLKSKKQEKIAQKKKKNEESDSDSGSESTSDNSEDEMDVHEYRKFLSKIFPSKDLNKKIKAGENIKKRLKKMKNGI
jgi:DNA/RNA-binding domain of Phe-tRNA-synthetase-like protein